MKLSDVLFIGGNVDRLASVKIRCKEIASRLGCSAVYGVLHPDDLPTGYKAFICVKPDFGRGGIQALKRKGTVIWDVLDSAPPTDDDIVYLTSSAASCAILPSSGYKFVIPHYHCNFDGTLASGNSRKLGYVGSVHWDPQVKDIDYEKFYTDRWSREETVAAYLSIGLAINLRYMGEVQKRFVTKAPDQTPQPALHVSINSGIKLINCMGFGIPSICSHEPAYLEYGRDCALFGDSFTCAPLVKTLIQDYDLYAKLRRNCIDLSRQFHIHEIAQRYRTMIAHL